MSSIASGSGGRPSTDISRRSASGNFEIRPEQRPWTVSFYVPLSKKPSFRDAYGGGILHPQIGERAVPLRMSVGRTEPKQKRNLTFSDGRFAHGIFPARPRARPTILTAD